MLVDDGHGRKTRYLLLRVRIEANVENGLRQTNFVMVDKINTLRREFLGERIGALSRQDMAHLERSMAVFLGLAG